MFYIWLAIALVPMFFCELACGSRVKSFALSVFVALIYFVIVAGLRDDTGYDWYVYKFIYRGISESGNLADAISFGRDNGSELGFSVYLYALSLLGLSFWWVQFLASIFNCYAFLKLNSALGRGMVSGVLIYYCWLFLVLQMAVLRMSIALSFLCLALLFMLKGKNVKFVLFVILATLFHTFSVVIGLLMLFARLPFSRALTLFFLLLFALMYVAGVDLAGSMVQVISGVMPEFISSKLNFYLLLGSNYQRGVGEFLYKLIIVSMYVFLAFRIRQDEDEKLLLSLSCIYVIVLLVFWKYPIFHDRLKYFILMPFFYLFLTVVMRMRVFNRLMYGVVFLMAGFMVLVHEVSGPLFFPYTPYYNMYERWLGGGGNDGEERTLKYYKEYDSQWFGVGQ